MSKHLERDLESLEGEILAQSSLVEEMIAKACRALVDRRIDLSSEVIDGEQQIDMREVKIEEECLKILALHQPVAVDLRRTATVLKINTELERIADLAVNIAERTSSLTDHLDFDIPDKVERMAVKATDMVHDALDAFVELDVDMAREVCHRDEEVDLLNREVIDELYETMRSRPDLVDPALHVFSISRHIERIADCATNIAEDVIYLVEGEIARHHFVELKKHATEAMPKARILIVEDDRSLADVLDYNLRQDGYQTTVALDGQDGLQQAKLKAPDLVVLDLMLPIIDGLEICRRLRADPVTRNILVLMLTAKGEETDQVAGFSVGTDDYVSKPFSVRVLLERVRALLRRRDGNVASANVLVSQGIMIDRERHRATSDDELLDLTPSEFGLLESLIRQPGRVFSRSELIDSALGGDSLVLERTIDVHIRSLRKKLDKRALLVETVRGVGYRFRDPIGALDAEIESTAAAVS